MPRISELKDINFDGIEKSLYTSRKSKDFKEAFPLHKEFDVNVDPVTHEVIRHNPMAD